MQFKDYKQFKAAKLKKQEEIAKAYPNIKNKTGIYLFYRIVGYVGKSDEKDGILGRIASHCITHEQHIDNSIQSRKLTCEGGEWHIKALCYCNSDEVNAMEQKFIAEHIAKGVELYNVESGGTIGKEDINKRAERGGYNKGKEYGYKKALTEIAKLYRQKEQRKKDLTPTATAIKANEKFMKIVRGETNNET